MKPRVSTHIFPSRLRTCVGLRSTKHEVCKSLYRIAMPCGPLWQANCSNIHMIYIQFYIPSSTACSLFIFYRVFNHFFNASVPLSLSFNIILFIQCSTTGSLSSKYVVYAIACVYREFYRKISDRKTIV